MRNTIDKASQLNKRISLVSFGIGLVCLAAVYVMEVIKFEKENKQ